MTGLGRRYLPHLWLLLPLTVLATPNTASAQQQPWATDPGRPPVAQPKPAPAPAPKAQPKAATPATPPPAQPKAAKEDGAAPRQATDAQLRARVEQLEEQLADMQVTIGTLESLGKSSGAAPPPGAAPGRVPAVGGGGVEQARVDSLETQIRALTAQMEQLSEQMRQLANQRRGDASGLQLPTREAAVAGPRSDVPLGRGPGAPQGEPQPGAPGFGSTIVRPGDEASERDPIGRLIDPSAPRTASTQPLPPGAAQAGSPKELYETAYGYLLQQDYGAAEVAFDEFLRRHPSDRLAADAQYWLGETLYVQRRFKPAGQAFLRVIEQHKSSAKVPNSILKLALALEQLGQKDCALFAELETRHPNAPADVKSKARALKQRTGC